MGDTAGVLGAGVAALTFQRSVLQMALRPLTYAEWSSWLQDLLMYSHFLTFVMQVQLLVTADVMLSLNGPRHLVTI